MTIDEAIKNLEFHIRLGQLGHHQDDITAVQLGIKALKVCKAMADRFLLLGETEMESKARGERNGR